MCKKDTLKSSISIYFVSHLIILSEELGEKEKDMLKWYLYIYIWFEAENRILRRSLKCSKSIS